MALPVFYTPRFRVVDANGAPMNGAVLKFFEAGTVTPLPVYADVDGNTELGVEVESDAFGLFPEIFMAEQAYKVELYTSADVLVWTADDFFPPQPASAASVSLLAVAGVTFTAGEAAYMSDGSGGLNVGQIYKADADLEYASNSPMVYFASGAVTAGETGLFIGEGVVTGLAGLNPGSRYYLSGTAGAITTTPGTFPRFVGAARTTTELAVSTNPPFLPDVDARVKHIVDGRLTLTTGVPVTTSDVTAAGTLYFTPYKGNQVAFYTGTRWVVMTFAEVSIAVPAAPNQVYDVFFDYNDGSPALALTAWTNDTTRATALTTQNGIYVKTGDTQQRYLGTVRTRTASQLNDSVLFRHVWNYYHRVQRTLLRTESTANWNYTLATFQQANNSAANQVDVVVGVAEVAINLMVSAAAGNSSPNVSATVAIGEDSVTTRATGVVGGNTQTDDATVTYTAFAASLVKYPAVGRHFYAWIEASEATGTTTWYSARGASAVSGLNGWIEG